MDDGGCSPRQLLRELLPRSIDDAYLAKDQTRVQFEMAIVPVMLSARIIAISQGQQGAADFQPGRPDISKA